MRAPVSTLALVAGLVGLPATAQTTTWLCGLSADAVQLVCVADADPVLAAHVAPATTAMVHGTRFPLDPNGRWVVDLWSPPTEPDSLAQLARATICYRSPGCEVVMAWPPHQTRWAMQTAAR